MVDPAAEDLARRRWLAISVLRLMGVAMTMVGLLIINQVIALPEMVGYVLIGLGLLDTFLVPQFLARKWRTPKS